MLDVSTLLDGSIPQIHRDSELCPAIFLRAYLAARAWHQI